MRCQLGGCPSTAEVYVPASPEAPARVVCSDHAHPPVCVVCAETLPEAMRLYPESFRVHSRCAAEWLATAEGSELWAEIQPKEIDSVDVAPEAAAPMGPRSRAAASRAWYCADCHRVHALTAACQRRGGT